MMIAMPFEIFDKRSVPLQTRPQMTIQARGTMSFNAASFEALGSPKAVELLYDRDAKKIGLRMTDPHNPNAYPMRVVGTGRSYIVNGATFLRYYRIPTGKPIRYDAELEGNILTVDLKKPGRVAISNRNRRQIEAQAASDDAGSGDANEAADLREVMSESVSFASRFVTDEEAED